MNAWQRTRGHSSDVQLTERGSVDTSQLIIKRKCNRMKAWKEPLIRPVCQGKCQWESGPDLCPTYCDIANLLFETHACTHAYTLQWDITYTSTFFLWFITEPKGRRINTPSTKKYTHPDTELTVISRPLWDYPSNEKLALRKSSS